jgi:hypothetical protein
VDEILFFVTEIAEQRALFAGVLADGRAQRDHDLQSLWVLVAVVLVVLDVDYELVCVLGNGHAFDGLEGEDLGLLFLVFGAAEEGGDGEIAGLFHDDEVFVVDADKPLVVLRAFFRTRDDPASLRAAIVFLNLAAQKNPAVFHF